MRRFNEVLREKRLAASLTLEQLSERTGLSYNAILGYERGATAPTVKVLQVLARVLCVSVGELASAEMPADHRSKVCS
jgi:transcriptional regulator with XRE-family HTH domain